MKNKSFLNTKLDPYGAGMFVAGRVLNKAGELFRSDLLQHTGTYLSVVGYFHTKNMEHYAEVLKDVLEEYKEHNDDGTLLSHMETVSVSRVIRFVAEGTSLEEEVAAIMKKHDPRASLASRDYAEGFGGLFFDGVRRNLGFKIKERDYSHITSIEDSRLYR